jgi:DNA-binding response OmpR family regulator
LIGVIVIDDEHDVSEVLCEFLKLKGIKVLGRGKNGGCNSIISKTTS